MSYRSLFAPLSLPLVSDHLLQAEEGFVAVEGLPGAGKSSLVRSLSHPSVDKFEELEPDGCPSDPLSYLRSESARLSAIRKSRSKGNVLLSDRSVLSTIVVRATTASLNPEEFLKDWNLFEKGLQSSNMEAPFPELLVFLQIPPSLAIKRQLDRGNNRIPTRWTSPAFISRMEKIYHKYES